ncbi:MAG: helix-turn-helix domain-containing protein [Tannerellaceae bacterium]|nr:helix-turn-helix domain-containing protein [Tannerellaceae bacterium]
MSAYKKISIDEVWLPPTETSRPFTPTGCSFLDVLTQRVLNESHARPAVWAERMGVTSAQLCETVRTLTDLTAPEWIATLSVRLISHWLLHTTWPIKTITLRAGFTSGNAMAKFYLANTGQTPKQFRTERQRVLVKVSKEIVVS